MGTPLRTYFLAGSERRVFQAHKFPYFCEEAKKMGNFVTAKPNEAIMISGVNGTRIKVCFLVE